MSNKNELPVEEKSSTKEKIRAIALDLDGTLVHPDHHVSTTNRKAVRRAAEQGVVIILSSGRPYASVRKIAQEIRLSELGGYIVSFNGAYVEKYTNDNHRQLVKLTIPMEIRKRFVSYMQRWNQAELLTYDDSSMLLSCDYHPYASEIAEGLLLRVEKVNDLVLPKIPDLYKYIIAGDIPLLRRIERELQQQFSEELSIIYGGGHFIEIMAPGVNKAAGVEAVLQDCKIDSTQLMCCGDSKNDLTMMAYAGYPIAMGNASEDVKQVAVYVTDSCEEDGVASAIYSSLS